MRHKAGDPSAPGLRERGYGPHKLPWQMWLDDMRERGIWAADWLRETGDPNVLCAIWTSERMTHGPLRPIWQRLDVERVGAAKPARWARLLRRRTLVLVCRCLDGHRSGAERPYSCPRSKLALLLVELGRRVGLPAIYCGETH